MALPEETMAPSVSTPLQSTSAPSPSDEMGRTCRTLKMAGLSGPTSRLAANSISTPQRTSRCMMPSSSFRMSASGKVLYLRIWAKVTNFGPCGTGESTIRMFS